MNSKEYTLPNGKKAVFEYDHDGIGKVTIEAMDMLMGLIADGRKHGEWIKRTHDTLIAQVNFAYCSECGQPIMHEHTRPLWSFCPNCGARMKGADDEAD